MLETLTPFYLAPNNNPLNKNRSLQGRENPPPPQERKRLPPCCLCWLILTCLHLAAWEISEPHLWVCLCFRKKFNTPWMWAGAGDLQGWESRWNGGGTRGQHVQAFLCSLFIVLCVAQNPTCHQLWWTNMSKATSQNKSPLLSNCSWQVSVTVTKSHWYTGTQNKRTASWKQNVHSSKPANFFVLNPLSSEAHCMHIH